MTPTRDSCPFCGVAIDPRRLDDLRQVIVSATQTNLAHYHCAKTQPLCPRHRQCFVGERCPRCVAAPPTPAF